MCSDVHTMVVPVAPMTIRELPPDERVPRRERAATQEARPQRRSRSEREASTPGDLRQTIKESLDRAGMVCARSEVPASPGYEILRRRGETGTPVNLFVRHSANDDAMVRQYGRALRRDNLSVTYFSYKGRAMLRVRSLW